MNLSLEKLKEARDAGIPDDVIWEAAASAEPKFNELKNNNIPLDVAFEAFQGFKPVGTSFTDKLQTATEELEMTIADIPLALGEAFSGLTKTAPASFYAAKEGLARPDQYSKEALAAFDTQREYFKQLEQQAKTREAEGKSTAVGEAIRGAGQSLGFTVAGMAPAIAGGAITGAAASALFPPAASATIPIGAIAGGIGSMVASAPVSYRMAGGQFLYDSFKELEESKGSPLTEEEKTKAYNELLPIAQNTALWEAGPEAIGNAVQLGALKYAFGFGKKAATNVAGQAIEKSNNTLLKKVGAVAGGQAIELAGETITQTQQGADQAKMEQYVQTGSTAGAPDEYQGLAGAVKAFKEVAPTTLALGVITAGAGGVVKVAGMGGKQVGKVLFSKPKTPEQIAEDQINDAANRVANDLSISPDDTQANNLNQQIKALSEVQEIRKQTLAAIEPTSREAQTLKLDIAEGESMLGELNKQLTGLTGLSEPITEAERQQAELAKAIVEEPAPTVKESLTVPPTPEAVSPVTEVAAQVEAIAPAPVEQVVTPPVEVAPAPAIEEEPMSVSDEKEFAELNDLMERKGQAENKVRGVKFTKQDQSRYQNLVTKFRDRLIETTDPKNDPVVGTDINGTPIQQSNKGTFYTFENGRVRTGPAFSEATPAPTIAEAAPTTPAPTPQLETGTIQTQPFQVTIPDATGQRIARMETIEIPMEWDAEINDWLMTEEGSRMVDETKQKGIAEQKKTTPKTYAQLENEALDIQNQISTEAGVSALIGVSDDNLTISGLESRQKGKGTKALEIITSAADKNQTTITLKAEPKSGDVQRLKKLYSRFGFVDDPNFAEGSNRMIRFPTATPAPVTEQAAPAEAPAPEVAPTPTEYKGKVKREYDSGIKAGETATFEPTGVSAEAISSMELDDMRKDVRAAKDKSSGNAMVRAYRHGKTQGRVNRNAPVFAEAVESYGVTLPEGYVKQGELYVYQPTPAVSETITEPVTPTKVKTTTEPTKTSPVASTSKAAGDVVNEIERVVDIKGVRAAKQIFDKVIQTLESLVEESKASAGFQTVEFRPSAQKKYGLGTIFIDGEYVASVGKYGDVRPNEEYELKKELPSSFDIRDLSPAKLKQNIELGVASKIARRNNKNQKYIVRIPGDGTFKIESNPIAVAEVVRRIKTNGPSAWKGIYEPKLGEKGGVLIPTKEDFIQAGQNIYEAGMEFGAWAKQMIQRFGDAVREFLGEVWQAVSGAPAKFNELMGYLPKKGEAGAVNIGQGENAPIKPEAKTVTEGLVQGIDIGKENNMPINNKIESHIKNFVFVRGIFESASDRLRRAKFTKLATAIDDYYDQAQRRLGFANKILLPAFEEYSKQSKATKAKIDEEVKMFFAAQENKRDTAEFFDELNPITQNIVTAWQKFGEESGKENKRIGIKVYDKGLQRWRPIGRVDKFWPRVLKPEYKRALMEPDKYQKEYNEIVEALMKSGRIENPEEAEVFISEYEGTGSKNDYFSGIETARGQAFPEELYDYSTQVMTDYVARWAQHSSRIEQFGQKLGENSMTLWDKSRASTRDRRTIDYITAAQERVEGYYPNDPIVKGMATLNIWSSGLQLGNPASSLLNFFGGTALNAMVGQPGAFSSYLSSFVELRKLGKELKDAREKGIVSRDLMNIVGDHQAVLEYNRIAKAGQKTTDFLLKWSGFTPIEQMVRTQSMIIGKSFLRKTLSSLSKNPNSTFSKRSLAWLNRNSIDADKLIVEKGSGPETDKLLRYFANISQGSYTIAQTPIFTDTPIGRFLFKYQKFSTQVMRQSWKNTFEPAWKAVTNKNEMLQLPDPTRQLLYRLRLAEAKELGDNRKITLDEIPKKVTKAEGKALTIIPVMMWLGSAYVGGEIILRMRDMLFGVLMKGPSYEDIIRAFEDDEDDDELYLALERAWYNLIGMGALGLIGNYAQFFMDWQDRERVKNPLDPPALSIAKETGTFIQNAADQGKITVGDVNNYLNRTLSAYRVSQRLYQTAASKLGFSKAPTVAEEMFRRETAVINKYARRWAESAGLEYRTKRPMDIAPSKMTSINREIASYLQRGEPGAAVAYAKEYLNSLPKSERKNAIQSMESGARFRQPFRLGNGPMDKSEKKAFTEWLKEKVSKEDFDKFQKLDKGYKKSYDDFLRGLPNK